MGLSLTSLVVMIGIIWAANPGGLGGIAVVSGALLAAGGVFAAVRLFKA